MNKKKYFASMLLLFLGTFSYGQGGPNTPPPPPGPPIPPGLPIDNGILILIIAGLVLGVYASLKYIKTTRTADHKDA